MSKNKTELNDPVDCLPSSARWDAGVRLKWLEMKCALDDVKNMKD